MATCRVEKKKDYTVMSNHHLRNKNLSLKARGLLSIVLSLPEEWVNHGINIMKDNLFLVLYQFSMEIKLGIYMEQVVINIET